MTTEELTEIWRSVQWAKGKTDIPAEAYVEDVGALLVEVKRLRAEVNRLRQTYGAWVAETGGRE
jgi:hypothetical protein